MQPSHSIGQSHSVPAVRTRGRTAAISTPELSTTKGQAYRQAPSDRERQVQVLEKWTVYAGLARGSALLEHTERSLKQMYGGVEHIRRRFASHGSENLAPGLSSEIQQQLQTIHNKVLLPASSLDYKLRFIGQDTTVTGMQMDGDIDLISHRSQEETIHIVLGRTGAGVSVKLLADADVKENLESIRSAFRPHQIDVEAEPHGGLTFSTDNSNKRKILEPWYLVGEGVRVAAGNPVQIKLKQPDSVFQIFQRELELHQTADIVSANASSIQHQIRQTLSVVKVASESIHGEMLSAINPNLQEESESMRKLSSHVGLNMTHEGQLTLPAVMAQSNTTRNIIRYGLL
jgi:hypothetical protein